MPSTGTLTFELGYLTISIYPQLTKEGLPYNYQYTIYEFQRGVKTVLKHDTGIDGIPGCILKIIRFIDNNYCFNGDNMLQLIYEVLGTAWSMSEGTILKNDNHE